MKTTGELSSEWMDGWMDGRMDGWIFIENGYKFVTEIEVCD